MRLSLVLWLFIAAATIHFFTISTEALPDVEGFIGTMFEKSTETFNKIEHKDQIKDVGLNAAQTDPSDLSNKAHDLIKGIIICRHLFHFIATPLLTKLPYYP